MIQTEGMINLKIPAWSSLSGIKKNVFLIIALVIVGFCAVIVRMVEWQLIKGNSLAETAKKIQTTDTIERANRGTIFDRNGMVLAESASVKTLVCNPTEVMENGDLNACIGLLSPIIGMGDAKLRSCLTAENSQYRVIKKRLSAEESNAIEELINPEMEPETNKEAEERNKEKRKIKTMLTGVYFENDTKRYYPYNIASHVLGFTGYDSEGRQGIEKQFDDYLSGVNGAVAENRSASGENLDDNQAEYLTAAKKGCDVTLTIDQTIQHFLEQHLEQAVKTNKLKEGAAGIIMNPKTGEIVAMATKPDFDCNNPNDLTQFLDYAYEFTPDYGDDEAGADATERPTEDPNNLSDTFVAQARTKMWRDKAVSDTYEPGSTFKIITAAAALEENTVNEDSNFFCPGYKIVADRRIECANRNGHGAQNFVDGVKNSCNPVFMEVGLGMGADTFMDYFKAFGFTTRTGVDLGGEANGIFYDTMNEVDVATSSFGQGFQVTPLQLITAISAVINGGERMKPLIVKKITNSEGVVKTYEPEVVNRVISEQTSEKMRNILEQVVSDPNATGKNAYVKGYRIGGKTGTSEKGNRLLKKRIASFVGFAPANDPELICLIMLDEPQTDNKYGGTIAAPVVGEILADSLDYLGIPKQYSENEEPDVYVSVPELRGKSVEEGKTILSDMKLKYRVKGSGSTVVDQLPGPDEQLEEDSIVVLYTEDRTDDDLVEVPDLKGRSVSDAKYILNNKGINFKITGAGHSESYNAYSTSQSVKKGTKVLPGSVIGVGFGQQTND